MADKSAANARRLACQQCDRHFTRPENLARHMKTHDPVQKHHCQTCGKSFTRSDLRRKHELLHSRPGSARSKARSQSRLVNLRYAASQVPAQTRLNDYVLPQSPGAAATDNTQPPSMDFQDEHLPDADSHPGPYEIPASLPLTEFDAPLVNAHSVGESHYTDPYFDYASFARPWDYSIDHSEDVSGWFSTQFFAALRETELACSPSVPETWSSTIFEQREPFGAPIHSVETGAVFNPILISQSSIHHDINPYDADPNAERQGNTISQAPSPPNERSYEDRLPFAWDPKSIPIAKAKPIILSPNDPILKTADPKLSISGTTLQSMCDFLHRRDSDNSEENTFTIPTLPLVNVFISLFFKKFLPTGPVLHLPTINVDTLPPALLAIIMVIGSSYSRLKYTRRFGIVVFDRVRRNIQNAIEADNSMMRDPDHIYTMALILFMGLWCGNKRTFELAKALQAVIVTYTRHLLSSHEPNITAAHGNSQTSQASDQSNLINSQWHHWITAESQKRIRWYVYMLDSQFCTLLGLSSLITLGDVRKWELPCDERFWIAPTAKSWKNLLGSASQPSCPIFGPLAAALLSPLNAEGAGAHDMYLPHLNDWSAKLLVTVITTEAFHFEQRTVVLRMLEEDSENSTQFLRDSGMRAKLYQSLQLWHNTFLDQPLLQTMHTSASYFQRSSFTILFLTRIYVRLSLTDIQECLGKSGPSEAAATFSRLRIWTEQSPDDVYQVVVDAAICISYILGKDTDSAPYDLIALFLCHLSLWIVANATSNIQKKCFVTQLRGNPVVSANICKVIEAGFAIRHESGHRTTPDKDGSQFILRHAIEVLVKRGTWGASANMALLLHLHPKMEQRGFG